MQACAAGLCQELLHLTLDKTNSVRCSNWETRPLSAVQKAYAATDAYAALAVYQVCGESFIHYTHAGQQQVLIRLIQCLCISCIFRQLLLAIMLSCAARLERDCENVLVAVAVPA